MKSDDIESIKNRFEKLKNIIDEMHVDSVNCNNDAKIVLEEILFDYHVKSEIIKIVGSDIEFYNILEKWINEVHKILKECYPLIYKRSKGDK